MNTRGGIRIWFTTEEKFQIENTFLGISELSDKEFGSLFSNWNGGMNNGIISTEDRTTSLNWETR
tara:strand:+ start:288 stop:482 length:195 start_codon:yes stop_codon:yes gene_type:complete